MNGNSNVADFVKGRTDYRPNSDLRLAERQASAARAKVRPADLHPQPQPQQHYHTNPQQSSDRALNSHPSRNRSSQIHPQVASPVHGFLDSDVGSELEDTIRLGESDNGDSDASANVKGDDDPYDGDHEALHESRGLQSALVSRASSNRYQIRPESVAALALVKHGAAGATIERTDERLALNRVGYQNSKTGRFQQQYPQMSSHDGGREDINHHNLPRLQRQSIRKIEMTPQFKHYQDSSDKNKVRHIAPSHNFDENYHPSVDNVYSGLPNGNQNEERSSQDCQDLVVSDHGEQLESHAPNDPESSEQGRNTPRDRSYQRATTVGGSDEQVGTKRTADDLDGADDLDYDEDVLQKMMYSELKHQDFDFTIIQPVSIIPESLTGPDVKFEDRLCYFKSKQSNDQATFFKQMSIKEWEDAGEWFLDGFGRIMREFQNARAARRQISNDFEEQLAVHEETLQEKMQHIDKIFAKMKEGGIGVLAMNST